jgi:ribosomal protein L23
LRELAQVGKEVQLEVKGEATKRSVLDALEAAYPVLKGTIRDTRTKERRAFVRFFACDDDYSHTSADEPLPIPVATGEEPFFIVGAMAGG